MPARRLAALVPALTLLAPAAAFAAAAAPAAAPDAPDYDVVDLVPRDPPSWSLTNVFAPITGIFLGGWGYWYDPREITIDTTPPGAVLDLFYVRRNFQKAYEQADAPARVVLPPRIEATSRDSITIRALLDGYRQKEVHVSVRSREDRLMIDLAPLPNALVALSHTYFAGRGSLTFLTREQLDFRLQKAQDGFAVVLTETADTPAADETMRGISSAFIASVDPQQLGEDLVVHVALTDAARDGSIETRSRQSVDPVRGLHLFALDLVPRDGGAAQIEQARAALARITTRDVTGCALAYDEALRSQLEPAALARALTPDGSFTDKFLRAAMKRLGEVSPRGVIQMLDGSTFRGAAPIELMAAATQPDQAVGYLALLRSFVEELEPEAYRRGTLRGLVAPELPRARFDAVADAAEARERACSASTAAGAARPGAPPG
jgi:hypothetical protein